MCRDRAFFPSMYTLTTLEAMHGLMFDLRRHEPDLPGGCYDLARLITLMNVVSRCGYAVSRARNKRSPSIRFHQVDVPSLVRPNQPTSPLILAIDCYRSSRSLLRDVIPSADSLN
jgi:hypothetical protein